MRPTVRCRTRNAESVDKSAQSAQRCRRPTAGSRSWGMNWNGRCEAGKPSRPKCCRSRELRRFYTPVYPAVHIPRGAELSAAQRAKAAWLWSRRRGVIAGLSAAAMLGTKWIEPGLPAELIHTNRRTPPMLDVHTDAVASVRDPTRRRHARDDGRAHRLRHRQTSRTRRGRSACRRPDERHRRQGQRYRVRGRGASWRPRPDATAADARSGRRRSRIAVRVADAIAVRASRISATGNPDTGRR